MCRLGVSGLAETLKDKTSPLSFPRGQMAVRRGGTCGKMEGLCLTLKPRKQIGELYSVAKLPRNHF